MRGLPHRGCGAGAPASRLSRMQTHGRSPLSRRRFLGAAAGAAGLFQVVPRHVVAGSGQTPPSEKLHIAGIGVGGQGGRDIQNLAEENIVALCDVDHDYAAKTFERFPDARRYKDYREMLEKEKGIDAVLIGTPDHTHAVIAAAAMRAGKHVFSEKPLTHDIREARALARIARETKVCTQLGIQGHSMEGARLIHEWVRGGVLGEIREVDAWCSLSYHPPGHASWSPKWMTRPEDAPAMPAGLEWDLWLGPAPQRAYHPAYHPRTWRAWWDFGNGMMGDRGVHTLDPVVWALDLGLPESIDATSLGLNPDTHPLASIVTFRFPAKGDRPPVKLTWYDGLRPPRPPQLEEGRVLGNKEGGALFKGSKGMLACGVYGDSPRLIPESAMKEFLANRPAPSLPRIEEGHYMNWARACKGQAKASADFEYGAHLTEICLLGNVAKRIDGRIDWDAAAMRVTNNEGANRHVAPEYRAGWTL